MPQALMEAYKAIFGHEPEPRRKIADLAALVRAVAGGFVATDHGRDLGERCLFEVQAFEDFLPHEVYSYAGRELNARLSRAA